MDRAIQLLAELGLWTCAIVGAASLLEAFCITGPLVPGGLVVDAAGIRAQEGVLHLGPLVVAVTLGSLLGGEASWWTEVLARRGRPAGSGCRRRASRRSLRRCGRSRPVSRSGRPKPCPWSGTPAPTTPPMQGRRRAGRFGVAAVVA